MKTKKTYPNIKKVTFRAGNTWDIWIDQICKSYQIPCLSLTQHQDVIITLVDNRQIAVELKGTDLYSSVFKKDIGGNFVWELTQYYLGQFKQVWCFFVGFHEQKVIFPFLSKCFELGVRPKWYLTHEEAIRGILDAIVEIDTPIDLASPKYINFGKGIKMEYKMLRLFFSERIINLLQNVIPAHLTPEEIFTNLEKYIKLIAPEDEYRLWFDWWHGHIEPKQNTLS